MRWKPEFKSLLAFFPQHRYGERVRRDPKLHTTQPLSLAQHSLLSRKEKYPPSPSHQVTSSLPNGQMQTSSLWLHSLFSKSLGFPLQVGVTLHKTKVTDVENRNNTPQIPILEKIRLLTLYKRVICRTGNSKVLKRPRV